MPTTINDRLRELDAEREAYEAYLLREERRGEAARLLERATTEDQSGHSVYADHLRNRAKYLKTQ